jgi:hypothetical protein
VDHAEPARDGQERLDVEALPEKVIPSIDSTSWRRFAFSEKARV